MSDEGRNKTLVLGGIRSGKSAYAESLVAHAGTVRYLATSRPPVDDPQWQARVEAHRRRRPASWTTEEVGAEPTQLITALATAKPDDTLLVDDLGGWVSVLLETSDGDQALIEELAAAVRACAARVVLVAPEVGLSLVPTTPLGRAFADALGTANHAVADACDEVVLVVAGQPVTLKPTATTPTIAALSPSALRPPITPPATAQTPPAEEPTATPWPWQEVIAGRRPSLMLPMPDEEAARAARDRLATIDTPGRRWGALAELVAFAAGTQGVAAPRPWRAVRALLVYGDHAGGVAAGGSPGESARLAAQARAGDGVWGRLAAEVGAELQVIDAAPAEAIEHAPALSDDAVDDALRTGWQAAQEAAASGVEALVVGACGAGSEAAAAAVIAATAGEEPVKLLAPVHLPGDRIDDTAWMRRCAAVRDALHRSRGKRRPEQVLAELGGGDIAVVTGILLGATAARIPVLLDGPVAIAACLVSREFAGQTPHWCLLPDHGGHPAVRLGAAALGLEPLLDLRLHLGEGATALSALPMLRAALSVTASLGAHPHLAAEATDASAESAEAAEPAGESAE
ncbi:MAG TPA: bifunctional adenosylcobinamide kinase/adenosylcobinamide-phosphate guanylyltransferase [Micromonospora sp.]